MFRGSAFTLNPTTIRALNINPRHHLLQCRGPVKNNQPTTYSQPGFCVNPPFALSISDWSMGK